MMKEEEQQVSEIFQSQQVNVTDAFSQITEIYRSDNSVLYRAQRGGKWWTLKTLPKDKSKNSVYKFRKRRNMIFFRHLTLIMLFVVKG